MSMRTGLLDKSWETTQIKVFTRWVAKQLKQRGLDFEDVTADFSDGTKLINLMEILGKEPMTQKWTKAPKSKFQALENITIALNYITQKKGLKLVGIGSSDIYDKNVKLTLGLTWTLILKYSIEEITVEEATARDALLIWAKKNTAEYDDVNITNFTTSWNNGLAFCALINHFRPNVLDYKALDKSDRLACATKAVEACKEIGLFVFMDPEDIAVDQPDEKSIVTQVAEYFHFFATDEKAKAMAEKLGRTVGIEKEIEDFVNDYEEKARATMDAIQASSTSITAEDYEKTVPDVKRKLSEVIKYSNTDRPKIVKLRALAMSTWTALVTKCKNNKRPVPPAPEGLAPEDLLTSFQELETTAAKKREELTQELIEIENKLVEAFDSSCRAISEKCNEIRGNAMNLSGTLQEQKAALEGYLAEAEGCVAECPALKAPYEQLVEYGLASRAKYSFMTTKSEAEQLVVYIKRLLEQNAEDIIKEENERRIAAYHEKAQVYLNEAAELEKSIGEIEGDLRERRTALINKIAEITEKRKGVADLQPHYDDLQKDNLHFGITDTPDKIQDIYGQHRTTAQFALNNIFDEMVKLYDEQGKAILERIKETSQKCDNLTGTLQDQKEQLEGYTAEAKETKESINTLDEPFQELTDFKLNTIAKHPPIEVRTEADQLITKLSRLTMQNQDAIKEEDNKRRIAEYEELAQKYLDEANSFLEECKAVDGERRPKLDALLEKETVALPEKRNRVSELEPHFQALEKDNLHLSLKNTMSLIYSVYATTLAFLNEEINKIYDSMVEDYNAASNAINKRIRDVDNRLRAIAGTDEEKLEQVKALTEEAEPFRAEIEGLEAVYTELSDYKIHTRVKHNTKDLHSHLDQLKASLQQNQKSLEEQILLANNTARVEEYSKQASVYVEWIKAKETDVNSVDGTNEEKIDKLKAMHTEIDTKEKEIEGIEPVYEELAQDQLHLNIQDTPASIRAFYHNLCEQINKAINELRAAIAAAKGLEISEEQLAEFRDTFEHFDKDKSGTLQYYELKACLTALGDTSTDDECKAIIKKYSKTSSAEDLHFEEYAQFMLDRFTKEESPEATKDAFFALTSNQPIITDEQIDRHFPAEVGSYLKNKIPKVEGGYDFVSWADSLYVKD